MSTYNTPFDVTSFFVSIRDSNMFPELAVHRLLKILNQKRGGIRLPKMAKIYNFGGVAEQ